MLSDQDFAMLIPELPKWNNGKGIDIDSWICCVGSFEHAVGYSRLFWPEFLMHDDSVFFREGFSIESYKGFMHQSSGDRSAVERVMNHRHLADLFCEPSLSPTREQLLYVGDVLQQMWTAKLHRDFPGISFGVPLFGTDSTDLMDLVITFHRLRG
jgi:hypothetical protein